MTTDPKVLFEDESLLVIDKPFGITVNNSDTTKGEMTVQDWVISNFQFPISNDQVDKESDFYKRAGIVHRLDKETSGILLAAKTPQAFENLQAQFKERNVHKTYVALAHGEVIPGSGEVTVPVGRLPWNRKHFGVLAGGKEAATKYKTTKNYQFGKEKLTLLELSPETGRTHQIRVHLKYLNHPIFSDYLYAGRKTARNDRKLLSRVFLHAASIRFTHPTTGFEVSFASPLPQELNAFLETLT